MSRGIAPITPAKVESEILRLVARLEEITDELAVLARAAADAEATYKAAYAKAFLEAEGTATVREHTATLRSHSLYKQRRYSEGTYASAKEALGTIRAQLDALRTISASIRSQT